MAINKILIPYNFTVYDRKSIDFVIRCFPNHQETKITILNAYTPLPTIDVSSTPEGVDMRRGMSFLTQELKEKEEGLILLRKDFIDHGYIEDQVDYIFKKKLKSTAEEIIETVVKGQFNLLVLSYQGSKLTRMFSRSIHEKVLASLKGITVCIAT